MTSTRIEIPAEVKDYVLAGGGICGTCADRATATAENQGYSYCCNDRIEYYDEALETVAQDTCLNATDFRPEGHGELKVSEHDGWTETECARCGSCV